MIGFSLSGCIQDLIRGRKTYAPTEGPVTIDDVEKIIAGTRCYDEQDFEQVVNQYSLSYWSQNPELAKQYAWQLYREGKIEQPRIYDIPHAYGLQRWDS